MLSFISDLILLHCSQESLPGGLFLTWSPKLSTGSLREHTHPLCCTELTSDILVTPASQSLGLKCQQGKAVQSGGESPDRAIKASALVQSLLVWKLCHLGTNLHPSEP